MGRKSSILGVVLGLLLIVPYVGAFGVEIAFSGPPLEEGYSDEYFMNGFWIVYKADFKTHTYFTKIINASNNKTVLTINERAGPVVPLEGGKYLLLATSGNEYSLRLYRLEDGTYSLVWKFDTSRYGWISSVLPLKDENLILAGTVDVSQDNFGGHYVIGIDFSGVLKFATNLHVKGNAVSDILPVGNGMYMVIISGFGNGLPYLGLIDESGTVVKSVKIDYPVASANIYVQGHDFVMMSWREKSEGYVWDLKTYYGIWTLNLTHVATVELPYEFLGATPVFDNNMLYLFTVEKSNSSYSLIESKYLLNGTLIWRRKVGKLKFEELPEPSKHCGIYGQDVHPVILPHSNVYVGFYLAGKVLNVVAVDFRDAVPLANASISLPVIYYSEVSCSVGFGYDARYIDTGSKVYSIDTTTIPSAVIIDSKLPANVTVDGKWSGRTPFYLNVEPGRHRVKIVRRNYSPIERVVRVAPHDGVRVFATLTPLNATVVLTSTPTAEVDILPADITVETPSNVSLRNGTYTFIFKSKEYPGQYERIRKTVTLLPNETKTINVELSLIRSQLNINSTVENATVYIDGKMVGNTPLQVFVVPGAHNITLKAEGYLPESIEINAARPVLNVSVVLTPVTNSNKNETFSSSAITAPKITHSSTSLKPTEIESKKDTHSTCGPGLMVFLPITALFTLTRRKGSK